MPYSSRILVAALLLLGAAQTSLKALALPLPSPVAQTPTTLPVPDTVPTGNLPQPTEEVLLAQENTPTPPPTTATQDGGFAWWWLLPIAGGVGALGWAARRRGSDSDEPSSAEPLNTAMADSAPPAPPTEVPLEPSPATESASAVTAPVPTVTESAPIVDAIIPPAESEPLAAAAPVSEQPAEPESVAFPTAAESVAEAEVAEPEVEASPAVPESTAATSPEAAPEPPPAEVISEVVSIEEVAATPVISQEPTAVSASIEEAVVETTPTPLETPVAQTSEEASELSAIPVESSSVAQPSAVPGMAVAAGAAGLAAGATASMASTEDQSVIEAKKFDVVGQPTDGDLDLSSIDDGLPPLPDGYGESRIVLMPRDPQWAYVYWDIPHTHKEDLRRQGGERLALRLCDVTNIDRNYQAPHSMQQCDCDELARDWYLQIPISDRDYQAEIGYLTRDGRWLLLARSNAIRIPPIYPSDWSEDHFKTVMWEEDLQGKTLMTLVEPSPKSQGLHEQIYALSQAGEAERVDGSLYGSMQHVPGSIQHVAGSVAPYESAVSSYAWASGAGLLRGMPGPGGVVPTMSGIPTLSGVGLSGLNVSGLNMSGLNVSGLNVSGLSGLTLSGVGFSASMPAARPRTFWLVADAELIVYGATEPDATVTIAGQPIPLSPEGTFRVQTSFPDGNIDYPIMAVAADGEQNRSIHISFDRQTLDRHTNTPEEAQDEWFEG